MFSIAFWKNLWALRVYLVDFVAIICEIKDLLGGDQVKAILDAIFETARKIKDESNNPVLATENSAAMFRAGINTQIEPVAADEPTRALALRMLGITEDDYRNLRNIKLGVPCDGSVSS